MFASPPVFAQMVETTLYSEAEQRIGFEYRKDVSAIYDSRTSEGSEASHRRLAPILAYCEAQEKTDRRTVSMATTAEYEAFLAEHADGKPTEWIDMACPMAYHLQGFLYSGDGKYAEALPWLERAIHLAPYYAVPLNERAYVLAHSGHLQEGLAAYRETLAFADAHPGAAHIKPLALRGIGWILTEMGDLDGAQASYEESLRIDPGNETALNELEYIRVQRKKAQAGKIPPD
jgi:tetratricopeptide (TPR) repeat protein